MTKQSAGRSDLFGSLMSLPGELEAYLRDTNPWWIGNPQPVLPAFRRWLFDAALQRLQSGLAPVTVLRGPRQVGKTTLQQQIIEYLLANGVARHRILRIQFDDIPALKRVKDPILGVSRWYERQILGRPFNDAARSGEPAFLFFDEVQNLVDWAPQVKALVDHQTVAVVVTGSSALRIEAGRDSLAGRVATLELGTLLLREISALRGWGPLPPLLSVNGLEPLQDRSLWEELRAHGLRHQAARDLAFTAFSERGGYPVAQVRADRPWEEIANQLNETVIRRVIQHDLRVGERGRKRDEQLLEELFRLSCRYAGQAPGQPVFVAELRAALSANIGWQRILAYLQFLNDTLLPRLVRPLELRLKRRKGRPKLCLCDHSLRASWLREVVPLTADGLRSSPHLADLAGHLAESVVGYFLAHTTGLDVSWFPERGAEPEVDFVMTVGERRIPVEVKYRQRIDEFRDTVGLRAFVEKTVYNAPFGILVTLSDGPAVSDPRIVSLPLSTLLLLR